MKKIHEKKYKYVIFSDIDATLIDFDSYEFKAHTLIEKLKKDKHFLILNSSKTSLEIIKIIRKIKYLQPFICENGSAIFFPKGFLKEKEKISKKFLGWDIIELSKPYNNILKKYNQLKKLLPFKIKGFSEMSIEEIMQLTNLPEELAKLAKKREYTEPFIILEEKKDFIIELENYCKKLNISFTKGGRFFHLLEDQNKGKAAKVCLNILQKQTNTKLISIAIGDSKNDEEMLKIADRAILMPRKDGSYDESIKLENMIYAPEPGSLGYCKILNSILLRAP